MCTLITYFRCQPELPLLLALNRDEFLERPTAPLDLWVPQGAAQPVVSGRDLRSGGTWFGVGRQVTAGLTNHRPDGGRSQPGTRSRGELVVQALLQADAAAVRCMLEALPSDAYGFFHLLAFDSDHMLWFTNRSGALETHSVQPGLHILGNFGLDEDDDPIVTQLRRSLAGTESWPLPRLLPRLQAVLAEHGPGHPCVHLGPYGTRSAAVLAQTRSAQRLWLADGAPCQAPFIEHSAPLMQLQMSDAKQPE